MAIVKSNTHLRDDIYLLEVFYAGPVQPGQFFMVRAWDKDPLLSRPISTHDYQDGVLSFLYQVIGKGTQILAGLKEGDELTLLGPLGKSFPEIDTDLVAVGGGIGIAPLYYACRDFKEKHPDKKLRVYLGFRLGGYRVEAFEAIADEVIINIGGIIVDDVELKEGETFITCGPEIMMKALCDKVEGPGYLSLESHMACGIGACLGCTCKTEGGNKKVCADGPVFSRDEVIL